MSVVKNELQEEQDKLALSKIAGKPQHIEINERTIQAFKEEFGKKGLTPNKEEDYPAEDFQLIAKQKDFDSKVDPTQGIKKIIHSMVRQPITVFDKNGKPQVKDALYIRGSYYGVDKRGADLPSAEYYEGFYRKPKLTFAYTDTTAPYDPKTGERRGQYKTSGFITEHYIFLPEDKKERRKILEDIVQKATGTYINNIQCYYRNPSANNDHSGTHGPIGWDNLCDLSISQLGQLQGNRYYSDDNGILRDGSGTRVQYDPSSKKVESASGR